MPRAKQALTISDGSEIHVGDTVKAKGEATEYRLCTVVSIYRNEAMLTAPTPFGTVWRNAKEIRPR